MDPSGWLTLPSLCAFLQEAARRSAAAMGAGVERLAADGLAWVLQRLKIEVAAYPRLGESLWVTTWPRRFDRLVALRDFEVRHEGLERLAVATSRWVVVDLNTRRVVRLPDFIRQIPVPDRRPALEIEAADLPSVAQAEVERRLHVRRSDLDNVRHVNNTRYIDWALEAVPDDCFELCWPARFEVVFRRESVYGDSVLSRAQRRGPGEFVHALARLEGGEELARALSRWEPRDLLRGGLR